MNNAGSIARLWWIDESNYLGLSTPAEGELPELLLSDYTFNDISFADDGCQLTINDSEEDNGTRYAINIILRVPKISSDNNSSIAVIKEALLTHRVIILALDNNNQYSLLGGSGSYFTMTRAADHGAVMADLNHTKVQITAEVDSGQVFIEDPFESS